MRVVLRVFEWCVAVFSPAITTALAELGASQRTRYLATYNFAARNTRDANSAAPVVSEPDRIALATMPTAALGPVAKWADAGDLKSPRPQGRCGFDPRRGHLEVTNNARVTTIRSFSPQQWQRAGGVVWSLVWSLFAARRRCVAGDAGAPEYCRHCAGHAIANVTAAVVGVEAADPPDAASPGRFRMLRCPICSSATLTLE